MLRRDHRPARREHSAALQLVPVLLFAFGFPNLQMGELAFRIVEQNPHGVS
jgi:hypothetical protein